VHYPGGKNSDGTWQRIISQIPPHRVYVELFGGSAAIARRIRPAEQSYVVERDPAVVMQIQGELYDRGVRPVRECAFRWLDRLDLWGPPIGEDWFFYVDPPYHPETLASPSRYRHDLTAEQHEELLERLLELPAMVMLSGYRCDLYDRLVGDWRQIDFPQITRGGWMATETLWMN